MARFNPLERVGVSKVENIISSLGWIFREQPIADVGIDAIIEQMISGEPTGKLIALQIKSGTSYFEEEKEDKYYFRIDSSHYNYWSNLSIPVIIILYNPDLDKTFWELFDKKDIKSTPNAYRIDIKKDSVLDTKSIDKFNIIIRLHQNDFLNQEIEEFENDYNHLLEICTLFTDESTELMLRNHQDVVNFAQKLLHVTSGIYSSLMTSLTGVKSSTDLFSLTMKKIEIVHNIYNIKAKSYIPIFFQLLMKSRSYLLLSIDFIKLPQFVNLIPDSIIMYKEVAKSINAFNKMISDINQNIEAYNLLPVEFPPNVKVAIDNKCEIDREYIYVLNNLSESTVNLLKTLPQEIKDSLTFPQDI